MSKAKKTIKISDLIEKANKILSFDISQEEKKGICIMLEEILHDNNAYHGFNFTYWLNEGCKKWEQAGKPYDNNKFLGKEYDRTYYK